MNPADGLVAGVTLTGGAAADFAFPKDAVTQSIAVVAARRVGKSNAGAVLAEEMFRAGIPWVAVDPKGDWWGLRSSADGTGPGLPIPVLGGRRGDVPLAPAAGPVIADLIVSQNLTCILDVSSLRRAGRIRFLAEFADRLLELHRGQDQPQPRHVFLDEAHEVIPQQPRAVSGAERGQVTAAEMAENWIRIIKQGGSSGIGTTIISQRAQAVSKEGLTQADTLVALRTMHVLDRRTIQDWVGSHTGREIAGTLPELPNGEGWVISPEWLPRYGQPSSQRVRFRLRSTYDSGATPTLDVAGRPPATLASIDLGTLAARLAAVTEEAGRSDPQMLRERVTELQARIVRLEQAAADAASLRQQVTELRAALDAERDRVPQQVEVPVLTPGDIAAAEQAITGVRDTADRLELALNRATRRALPPRQGEAGPAAWPRAVPGPGGGSIPAPGKTAGTAESLPRAQRLVLSVLAQFPAGRTKRQIAILAGYSVGSGGYAQTLARLREAGYISYGEKTVITSAGLAALGHWDPLPEGPDLIRYWLSRLPAAQRNILQAVLDAWPETLTKEQVAGRTGYSVTSGGYAQAIARLRDLELLSRSGNLTPDSTLTEAVSARTPAHG